MAITLWAPKGLFGLGITTISALLQILGIMSWRMQEVQRLYNQDLRADLAWSINSGKIESKTGDFPGFKWLRALTNSSGVTEPEILSPSGGGTFRLAITRLCAPFFTSCEAIEFAEMGHRREKCPDLPESLLMVLHVLLLECEKSMELTAFSH